jgi:hypothetical protein
MWLYGCDKLIHIHELYCPLMGKREIIVVNALDV